jgi:hypothetical protein
MTVAQAASLLGCSPSQFYRLRTRIAMGGDATSPAREREDARQRRDAAIVECALAYPDEGPDKLVRRLRQPEHGAIVVAHGTVGTVLRRAGLAYVENRRLAARSGGAAPQTTP